MHRAPLWLMKPTRARPGHLGGEGGVQAAERAHHAQAVGPDEPHPPAPGLLEHLLLELGPFRPDFLEAGRDDDRPRDTGLDALADHAGHRRRGRHDHRQVDRLGHCLDRSGYALIPSTLGRLGLTG